VISHIVFSIDVKNEVHLILIWALSQNQLTLYAMNAMIADGSVK
jgi:hypothetical protein